jgi:hypothetical protein
MKPSGAYARVWVTLPSGEEKRVWLNLGTKDPGTAKRKLALKVAKIEAGEVIGEIERKTGNPETYKSFTLARHDRRAAAGVVMARDEQNNRVRYIYPAIGDTLLTRVTDDDVRRILERAAEHGLARETVHKIRAVMRRDLKRARIEKVIEGRPAEDVELPDGLKKDKRPRAILSDAEIAKHLGAPTCDLEIKLLALTARTERVSRNRRSVEKLWK